MSTQFLHRSTDAQLSTVINDLHRRHIALGTEAEIMADDPAHPYGAGIPGHTSNAVIRTAVDRVARLGGKIDYVYSTNRSLLATCMVCHLEFISALRDARCCSYACRQWAYQRRQGL